MSADKKQGGPGVPDDRLENEFRAMFAERSQMARTTTAPYATVRQRIAAARRKRRMRFGSAGMALAVAAVGIGVWATVPGRHHAAVAPTSKIAVTGTPAKVVYDDQHTEIPAGPLRDAALNWLRTHYHGDLTGLTVVTTFNKHMQDAASAKSSGTDRGVVVLDSANGMVVALGGAWDRPVQTADLMKPIVLAAAFETGHYTPETTEPLDTQTHPLYWPPGAKTPMTYPSSTGGPKYWPPEAPTTKIQDTDVSLLQATENGDNGVFARVELASDMTLPGLRAMAVRLGMPAGTADLLPVPALALGTPQASPLTMAEVYATFAAGGIRRDPIMVGQLLGQGGKTVWTASIGGERVLSPGTAQEVVDVLHGALAAGPTGSGVEPGVRNNSLAWGMAAASDPERSAWFDGAVSNFVFSIGLSKTDAHGNLLPLDDGHGGLAVGSRLAGPIFAGLVHSLQNQG